MRNNIAKDLMNAIAVGTLRPQNIEQHYEAGRRNTVTVTFEQTEAYIGADRITAGTFPPRVGIEKVVYNDPATIVYWNDGTKTVVKCHEGDIFDERTGFLLCCAKKLFGNTGRYNDAMKANVPEATKLADAIRAIGKALDRLW